MLLKTNTKTFHKTSFFVFRLLLLLTPSSPPPPIISMPGWKPRLLFIFHNVSSPTLTGFDVAQMEHAALHLTSREKPLLVILYVFSVLFITTLTAGVKWETSRKNLPRLPSGKVELKLERGITWTKAPRGREWEWKRKERKGDRSSVMGCRCSVLGMIKQWGWIRALSYDKHMHTQTHKYTPLCLTI